MGCRNERSRASSLLSKRSESSQNEDQVSSAPVSEYDTNTHSAAWQSALILANPIAGKGRGAATAEAVASELQRVGLQTEIQLSKGPGDTGPKTQA